MPRGRTAFIDRSYTEDEYVKKWLVGLAETTKKNYSMAFKQWLDFIQMTPTEQIKKRIQDSISQDLTERQFFEVKFREYKGFLETTKKLTASTVTATLKVMASFFGRNGLHLNLIRGDWQATTTHNAVKRWTLTNKDVRRLYSHANVRDRALLLTLYHTGLSEVDLVNLKIEDLKGIYEQPETEHYFLEKPREKTGMTQATCISFEALHDIKSMLQARSNPTEGYLFTSQTKATGKTPEERKQAKLEGLPLQVRAVNTAIKGLAEKAFGTEKAKDFKTKSLRSSYNSALLRASIQQEVKDLMLGHKRKGARGNYAYDEQTIREAYDLAFTHLTVNGIQSRQDIEKLRNSQIEHAKLITDLNEKLENQDRAFKGIFTQLSHSMKKTFDTQQHSLDSLKEMVARLYDLKATKPETQDQTENQEQPE